MKKIKVIRGGCGVIIANANGTAMHVLKTPDDAPFECDDVQAEHFVKLKVAKYVEPESATDRSDNLEQREGEQDSEAEVDANNVPTPARFTAEQLEAWEYNDLKKLAAEMGINPVGKKKADYINAIVAFVPEAEEEDEIPKIGVADPE